MTIPYCFVGYGVDSYAAPALRYAYAIGRQYCPDRIPVWTSNDPELSPPPLHHRYIPVDMPVSADQWGVAYPAGTKLLVDTTAVMLPRLATIEADWANWWNGNFQAGGFDLYTNGYMAVPSTLPTGYTERLKRDWRGITADQLFYDTEAPSGAMVRTYEIRTATGYTETQWVPTRYGYGYAKSLSRLTGAGVGLKYWATIEASTGYRKLQYRLSFNNSGGSAFPFPGNIVFKVMHNADGSATTPFTSDDDTTDYTGTHPDTDFTHVSGGDQTAWIDAGEILPTLGTVSLFRGSVDTTTTGGFMGDVSVSLRLSPRVDIPAPFTVTGRGSEIIRGGLPT